MAIFAGYFSLIAHVVLFSFFQANILLDDGLHVQIADFGLTRLSEATNTRSGALHLNFAAPELFGFSEDDDDSSNDTAVRTQMSDVYAFGCVYYEVGNNKYAYMFLLNCLDPFRQHTFCW